MQLWGQTTAHLIFPNSVREHDTGQSVQEWEK